MKTRDFFRGFGSILDIVPQRHSLDLSKFTHRDTSFVMMKKAWKKVGADIETALGQFEGEQGNKKKSA